jgi:hypothetical protein
MQLNSVRKTLAAAFAASALFAVSASGQVITQWNFNGTSAATVPGGTAAPTPSVGTGSASLIGGVTAAFTSGTAQGGSTDPVNTTPPNYGWNLTGFPAQGANSGTAGARFAVDTTGPIAVGITGVEITFDLRTSNTASRWYRLDYTTDGSTWNLGTPTRLGAAPNAGDTWHNGNSVVLNDLGTLNNPGFAFRIVSVFSPVAFTQISGDIAYDADSAYEVARNNGESAYLTTGTWRFDMVTVSAIPEPSTYAAIFGGAVLLLVAVRRFRRKA